MQSFGLGLRAPHYQDFLGQQQPVDWLEVISENYMIQGGKPLRMLNEIRQRYPIVMHGVSMSLASVQGVNPEYLADLKKLIDLYEPNWVSDHLCWNGVECKNLHDLLPLPFTREALQIVQRNLAQVQEAIKQPLVIENISSYLQFEESEMTEWEFLNELTRSTGCKLLFDINNWYVNSVNFGYSAKDTLLKLAPDCVQQFHLAGHTNNGDHLIDTHDSEVCDPVWRLYEVALEHFGPTPTMIERDDKIPPLSELLTELAVARKIAGHTLGEFA